MGKARKTQRLQAWDIRAYRRGCLLGAAATDCGVSFSSTEFQACMDLHTCSICREITT